VLDDVVLGDDVALVDPVLAGLFVLLFVLVSLLFTSDF